MSARTGLCPYLMRPTSDGTLGFDRESPSSQEPALSQASRIETLPLPAYPRQGVAFPTPEQG
eukprot:scaffold38771_cov555-Skeletonema_dohrnii-CCMP3373.AAC.1